MVLDKLIAECSDYDFKEQLEIKKSKSWLKTVSAFANGIGGILFFGINNNKEFEKIDISSYMISSTPREKIVNQNVESYNYKDDVLQNNVVIKEEQTLDYVYKARCNRKRTISEVILWKIISDSAGSSGGCSRMMIPRGVRLYRWIPRSLGVGIKKWIPDKDIGITDPRISILKYEEKQKDINLNFMKGEL